VNDRGWIDDEDIPLEYHLAHMGETARAQDSLLEEAVNTFERSFILKSLERCEWNVTATARYLGVPLSTLKHKMGRLEIREIARRLRSS
jgi:DNA-binding NtrC family response regulator